MTRGRDHTSGPCLLLGADVLTGGKTLPRTAVLLGGGNVLAVGREAERQGRKSSARRVDVEGRLIAPGYVDLHTHGAVGIDFVEATRSELDRAARHYLRHGVTAFLASLYPSSAAKSLEVVDRIARDLDQGAGGGVAMGIHLEGPYLNPKRPGALPGALFRAYDRAEVDALLSAGRGWIRTMTVAPEMKGGMQLVRHLLRRGVMPAFGHSDAGYDETRSAIAGGIRYATHLFNAMRGLHHRDPGAVTALLEDPRVAVELIADGFHVDPAVLRLVNALKPRRRVVLVSDSVHPCGLKAGRYSFAGMPVRASGGRITLLDGTLAGSLLTLDRGVALEAGRLGVAPAEAVRFAGENAAQVLGDRTRGRIAPGKRADLVVLDGALRVVATWLGGRQVYGDRTSE